MKRRILLLCALASVGLVSAAPVFADTAPANAANPEPSASLVGGIESGTANLVNPILAAVPAPAGWHHRFVCVWNDPTNQQICLYFPFPS
ncbi:MAG TPA: hypothetical protein VHD87_01075 [Acidimicrobiales bacterium]|nr:hypothetical protein [Acidimicrobiales bacterium]